MAQPSDAAVEIPNGDEDALTEDVDDDSEDTDASPDHRIIRVTVAAGERSERIDTYLARTIANTSRTKVHEALDAKAILVNGLSNIKASYKIKGGDSIEIHIPRPAAMRAQAEDIALDIIYEDEDILIINKPAGMVVHPAIGSRSGTLVNALLYHIQNFQAEHPSADPNRPGIVHRLDKDTSGLLVVAKNEQAHRVLAKQFFLHTAQRTYQAILWGIPDTKFGTIDTLQGRHPKDRKKFTVVSEGGKQAITEFFVMEEFNGFSLVEFRLKTGRTHQIRVHAQHIGHPIFGDAVYGGRSIVVMRNDVPHFKDWVEHLLKTLKRQALHAYSLKIHHPISGQLLEWRAPMPEDMRTVLEEMRLKSSV